MVNYESFYKGSSSPFEPSDSEIFTGYRISAGLLGSQTSGVTADQVREVSSRLSEGVKHVEFTGGVLDPQLFDLIPKQHLKEIDRLAKLTGAEMSIHAPIIEPSGTSQGGWSEMARQETERQLLSIVERSHLLSPNGNIPVVLHSSNLGGSEYRKPQ